jgi:hypothetical protein
MTALYTKEAEDDVLQSLAVPLITQLSIRPNETEDDSEQVKPNWYSPYFKQEGFRYIALVLKFARQFRLHIRM